MKPHPFVHHFVVSPPSYLACRVCLTQLWQAILRESKRWWNKGPRRSIPLRTPLYGAARNSRDAVPCGARGRLEKADYAS